LGGNHRTSCRTYDAADYRSLRVLADHLAGYRTSGSTHTHLGGISSGDSPSAQLMRNSLNLRGDWPELLPDSYAFDLQAKPPLSTLAPRRTQSGDSQPDG
jgi:hypothetical protein